MGEPTGKCQIYFGEITCQARFESGANKGKSCNKKAYYKSSKLYVCGMHSSGNRTKLQKNPHADRLKRKKITEHEESVDAAQKENKKKQRPGEVKCAKMRMMSAAPYTPGYLNVYPNFKHQKRQDGFGCASLSPMSLGPVHHGQKDVPPAKCLENYHQFNKVYDSEMMSDGQPTQAFRKTRLDGYTSSTPMRHKFTSSTTKRKQTGTGFKKMYSLHSDAKGVEKHYTWVQSRYFYCHFYEQLARKNSDLQTLREKIKDGVNVQITGYDGCDVTRPLNEYYESTERPFGHELVLYTILTVSDPKQYPWNEYYMKHKELYPKELAPSGYGAANSEEQDPEVTESE